MTFKTTVHTTAGTPANCWVAASIQETGQVFARNADGNGYADLACPNVPVGYHVTFLSNLQIVSPTYGTITQADQTIGMVVQPFKSPLPTRDQVCGLGLTFQGLIIPQFPAIPSWFETALQCIDAGDRQAVYAAKHAAGDTHQILEFLPAESIYNESEQPFQSYVSPDFEANPTQFLELVIEVLENGFTPVVAFNGDNADNPVDGYPNALRQLPILVNLLSAYNERILYARLWDGVFYGSTPANIQAFGRAFRSLLPNGYLAIEHQPGKIPVGNGPSDYGLTGMMADYDTILAEMPNWPATGDAIWQVAGRMLGPGYRRPPDQPSGDDPNPPWYLESGCPRGSQFPIAFEWGEYPGVRGLLTPAQFTAGRAYYRSLGYTYVS